MRMLVAFGFLALAGCQTKPQTVEVFRTVEVKVPVSVPCLKAYQLPEIPAGLGPVPADQGRALSIALSRLLDWKIYGETADAMLRACSRVE